MLNGLNITKPRPFDFLNPAVPFLWAYLVFLAGSALFVPIDRIFSINLSTNAILALVLYPTFFLISSHFLSNVVVPKRGVVTVIDYDIQPKKAFLVCLLFYVGAVTVFCYVYYKIGFIPLFHAEAENIRVTAKQGLGYFYLLATAALYVVNIVLFSLFRLLSHAKKLVSIAILLTSSFLVLGLGYRGPALMLPLSVIYVFFILNDAYLRKRRVNLLFIILGSVVFSLLLAIGVYRYRNEETIQISNYFLWIITVNLSNLIDITEYFHLHEYRYFTTIINDLKVAIPGMSSKFFGNELKTLLNMTFPGEGMTVTAPGEGYANFGLAGVAVHAAILGIIVGAIYNRLIANSRISRLIVLALFSLNIWRMATAGITPTLIFSLGPSVFVYFVFLALVKKGKL